MFQRFHLFTAFCAGAFVAVFSSAASARAIRAQTPVGVSSPSGVAVDAKKARPAHTADPVVRPALVRAAYAVGPQDAGVGCGRAAPSARRRPTRAVRDPALNRFAIGVGGGTNGGSLELAWSLNRYLTLRGQGAVLDFDHDFKSSDTTYRGKLRHNTAGGMLDLHPFQNAFFVSGGVVTGERKVSVDAVPSSTQTLRINGVSYVAAQVLTVKGDVALGDTAPIFGLGYDNTFTTAGHWGFRAFGGAIIGDTPKVTLSATGPLAADPTVRANLAAEQASLQSDAKDFKYYPTVSVGLFYKF